MAAVWGALFAAGYFVARRYVPGTIALAALVVSHWILDWLVHVPICPWCRGADRFWPRAVALAALTMAVELILFAAGVATYLRSTRARDSEGAWDWPG